ncbi:MAPK regulated corepressor interacting protein 2 [Sitophilus oryzae]|uniref:MAPK regulated corepressor interacting protein 2 n=1 Tax=Sitophilus oryzae TaxID=7048 RepID=A0A6J2XEH6_SITOR|nr:MAPK regulated corepressor interacting protein 2 [Sitophilus oryzae]
MYNIKGPSKIVAKTTRRGISQSIENYKDYGKNKLVDDDNNICNNVPKIVFQKRTVPCSNKQESMTPEQVDVIKFIHESWSTVISEYEQQPEDRNHTVCFFQEENCDKLQDFKPFDLESWWGKRLYAHITSSTETLKD